MNANPQIYFMLFIRDFSKTNHFTNGLSICMNEYFMQNFDDCPILLSYRNFPKDFKIIVGSKTFSVMRFVYENIRKGANQDFQKNEIILKTDEEAIFSHIVDLINGENIHLSFKDSMLLRVVSSDLFLYPIYECISDLNTESPIDICISPISLVMNMKNQPKNFTINTKNNSYKCNKIAAAVSQVIMDAIKSDNSIDSYFYDYEEQNNEFQIICNYLNFEEISILPENIEFLSKCANDLKFDALIKICKNIEDQQNRFENVLDENQEEIDYIDELFEVLTSKNEADSVDYIIHSRWLNNYELQKELIGSLISLVYSSPKLLVKVAKIISSLFDNIDIIQKSNAENSLPDVDLKMLKKFLMRRIIDNVNDDHNGPFIYELIKLNFIQLHKINKDDNNNKNDVNTDDEESDDDSDLLIRCLCYQFTALWILPELDEIVQSIQNFFKKLKQPNMYSLKHFLDFDYVQNNWKKLREIRETKQSQNPIAIALAKDDIAEFQKLFYLPHKPESLNTVDNFSTWGNWGTRPAMRTPVMKNDKNSDDNSHFNDSVQYFPFDLYSDSSYIDYAAFHGSIQCFKFLLINGAKVTMKTFDAAIEGGNIELVRITEQKLTEIGDNTFYNGKIEPQKRGFGVSKFNNKSSSSFAHHFDSLILHPNSLKTAICNHNNDIFDWIFENKKINASELNNLLRIASLANNLHVISIILSEKPFIENYINCLSYLNCISNAASLGFSLCVKMLIEAFGQDIFREFSIQYDVMENSYSFDIVDIFKMTWYKEKDTKLLINLCSSNSISIFKYCYNDTFNNRSSEFLINFAIKNNNDEIFKFLFNQINKIEDTIQKEILIKKLLKNTVKCNCLPMFKCILKSINIYNKFSETINQCLLVAAKNGYEGIFKYIISSVISNFSNDKHKKIVNEISKNFFAILQSGNLEIIKSIISFIDNESYIKMMMFDLLVKESEKTVKKERQGFGTSTYTFSQSQCSFGKSREDLIKSIFSIKNVTEFLINYVDEVIPIFLLAATRVGNIEAVKAIVKKNSTYDFLNQVNYSVGNALCIACENKSNDIAKFLLESCPEIDPTIGYTSNGKYMSPLTISASKQNFELIQAIVHFCQSNEKNLECHTNEVPTKKSHLVSEVQKAISSIGNSKSELKNNFEDIISYLITIDGIDLNEVICGDLPFLSFICDDNLIGLFNHILSLPNINPNICDLRMKETPLIKAIFNNQNKIISALLAHKDIDINIESFNHVTALSMAVHKQNLNVIEMLVKNEKLKVENNLNYSVCLYHAIKSKYIECIELLLSRPECNVNEIIPYSYKDDIIDETQNRFGFNNRANNNLNRPQDIISVNLSILEQESKYHSASIIQAAAASDNIDIVKDVISHPKFIPEKSTLTLAIFESIKINNSEIFELLTDLYSRIDKDFDVLDFYDLNFNSLVVIASATNNIDFINLVPNLIKSKKKDFSTYNNQIAFLVAPTVEMMTLIMQTLPGVDLSAPLEDGSNYLTALIDFYLFPTYLLDSRTSINYNMMNNAQKETIVMEKVDFILQNSNLKITTKDNNGFSFLTKATSHAHCLNYMKMTSLIYSNFLPQDDNQESYLIDEETQMTPLHMLMSNIQALNFIGSNKETIDSCKCEDDFDFLVNQLIIECFSKIYFKDETYYLRNIFESNSSLFHQNRRNFIDNDINSVDILNQTPIIKAVLSMNIYFANFLFSICKVKIDVIDIFGNTLLDYLLIIIDYFMNNLQSNGVFNSENKYHEILEIRQKRKSKNEKDDDNSKEINEFEVCSSIFKDILQYLSNDNQNGNVVESDFLVSIIIKLSTYLVPPSKK